MKKVCITTSEGTTITYTHGIVPVITLDGRNAEKYVSDLREGDFIYFRSDHAPVKLNEIVSLLYQNVQNYASYREFCFVRSDGYEITRLRKNLITSLMHSDPTIFYEDDLENFDDYLFMRQGKDFSEETYRRLTHRLQDICESSGMHHSYHTYKNWLAGDIIHPENPSDGIKLGQKFDNSELIDRSQKIQETPHSENPYFSLVDAHRRYTSLLSHVGLDHKKNHNNHHAKNNSRVHKEFGDWDRTILEILKPRIEEGIKEAQVYGVKVIEDHPHSENMEHSHTGLRKGVVVFVDEENAQETYQKLKISPESRRVATRRALKDSFDITTEIYKEAIELKSDSNFQFDIADFNKVTGIIGKDGEIEAIFADIGKLCFMSPLYDYNANNMLARFTWIDCVMEKSSIDRNFRRDFVKKIEKNLPEKHPLHSTLSAVYNKSLLLQSLYNKMEYIKNMTNYSRQIERKNIEDIGNVPVDVRKKILPVMKSETVKAARYLNTLVKKDTVSKLLSDMKRIDTEIPIEISTFRSFPVVSGIVIGNPDIGSETAVLNSLLNKYRIDADEYIKMVQKTLYETLELSHAKFNQIKSSYGKSILFDC